MREHSSHPPTIFIFTFVLLISLLPNYILFSVNPFALPFYSISTMAFPRLGDPTILRSSDLSLFVPGTSHTLASIVAILRGRFGQNQTVQMVEAEPIDGQGLMSSIHRIRIYFADGGNFVAILKVATTAKIERLNPIEDAKKSRKGNIDDEKHCEEDNGGWDMEKFRTFLSEMFELEVNFYAEIVPLIPPDLCQFVPRPFAVLPCLADRNVEKGFLLLEDVSVKGVPTNFYEGFTAGQVASTIVHLARFHAFSLSLPADLLSRFRVREYGNLEGMEEQMAERVLNLPGSEYFHRNRNTLRAFMLKHNRMRTDVHTRMGIRPVLCHGDLWGNNLFFERRKDEKGDWVAGDAMSTMMDWQSCHENTGLNDVIRLMFSCVNAPLRKERTDEWMDLYFSTLEEESRRIGKAAEYSKEMRRQMFEEQCHFELTFCLMCFPTLYPEAKNGMNRRNLMERMEAIFEEGREKYK